MPAKTKRISTLIESQLPSFISDEYELFARFVEKYYESQEVQGGPLDIANNLSTYLDIDFYEKDILKQNDVLVGNISETDTSITLEDASSFPEKNGYVRINDEIIFYASKVGNELQECFRGVSGNTKLGDLYSSSNFQSTDAGAHYSGATVYNISNLFLYAFVKNFESQYLGSFPEKYLKGEVDKRTLIKNIQKFYKSKGTASSIKFIFNTIVSREPNDSPEVYNPKDFTYKVSKSDWISAYAIKVKVLSGDPKSLVGQRIVQPETEEYGFISAVVDNVKESGNYDGEQIWDIILAPETVTGKFAVSTKTTLTRNLSQNDGVGKRVNVFSTVGWENTGSILIGSEVITFEEKNVTQFTIKKRGNITYNHSEGDSVYKPVILSSGNVELLSLGIVYNFDITDGQPHSFEGDQVQVSNPGFETSDPKIVNSGTNVSRWVLYNNQNVSIPTNTTLQQSVDDLSTDVSAIFADDQYYYITSSGFPSHDILTGSDVSETLLDQNILRIIRKNAIRTTEKYKTPKVDTGILLNGIRTYSYKDTESIRYGILESIDVDVRGSGYIKPPFVLLDGVPNKARAILSGSVVESYVVDTTEVFRRNPLVEVTSGRGAVIRAIVTGDEITSLVIDNPGEYYSSPPLVVISDSNGRGKFADYTATVNTNGQITGFTQNATGKFYNQQTVRVDIIPVGSGATAKPVLTEWNYNRYEKLKNDLDTENGYLFQNYTSSLEYGYGYVANPKSLRISKNDNLNLGDTEPATKTHSPILGFAYDGNPIYGPFGYQDPLDDVSNVIRMTSSYSLNNTRSKGPLVSSYPLGTFVNDYTYNHKSGTLDENNGRYCVTPDYPEGTYAYFITIDENQEPQFPYLIGENYYSLPVSSNYDSPITQNEIPKRAKRFFSPGIPRNGEGVFAQIADVRSGTVDAITSVKSSDNFSVNSRVYFDNRGSFGNSAEALVESVKGKTVSYLDSFENKVVKLTTIQNAYLFTDDILRQPSSQASGTIVGNIENDNVIVLKDVVGTFDNTGTFSADIKTFFLLLDQKSSFTKGATVSLTDGINAAVATGEVLNGTSQQNTLEIKVLSGDWLEFNDPDFDYFLQSDDFFNTSGSRVVTLTSLSDNLEPFEVNQSVALVETTENHGLGIGDSVSIDIFPNDSEKTKTYFVRNRLYQEITLKTPEFSTTIDDTGVGRFQILNGGADYTPGLYTDVPLTGGDGTGLTANITVSSAGIVSDVQIETKGSGYTKANYLSVEDDQLGRALASQSTSRLTLYVDHVGYGKGSTRLIVSSSVGLVEGDLIKVGDEVLEVSSISGKTLTVLPGRENTEQSDHYNDQPVSLYKASYNFPENYQLSNSSGSGYVKSYDQSTQKALIVFNYNIGISNAEIININTSFFDASQPSRTVSVKSVEPIEYKFEFSEGDENGQDGVDSVFVVNPIIEIQEYYRYVFDTYHPSMNGISFDVSPSKNYNIITEEKLVSTIAPGNPGSYTEVKFGFGSRIATNQYTNKVGTDFSNFYYFDKNGIVDSDGKYLTIVQDPLQGQKTVNYVTPNRFVYDIDSPPLWDGSGTITYTTSGQFAVGEINSYKIINLGSDYKKTPIITGVYPNSNFIATATVVFDEETKLITGIDIDTVGSNYSKPKVVVVDGDGEDVEFEAVASDGKIFSLTVKNPGRNYTYAPIVNIIESDVEAYVDSSTIGIPQSVSIIQNGGAFHLDKTISSDFTSKYTVSLTTPTIGTFAKGETVVQTVNGTEVLRARVSESRVGSNLLKIENVVGTIREDVRITGLVSNSTGTVKSVFVSTLKENITSSYDNIGYFKSDRGRLGAENQKLLDSFFYQDYSYVVKSKTPIDQWRDLIKSTTHPAGFRLFGQVDIETSSGTEMPVDTTKSSHFSIVQLWDPNKNKITVENTRRTVTQIVQKVENTREIQGLGSVSSTEFNFNESVAFTFRIYNNAPGYYDDVIADGKSWWSKNSFDGYYDNDGRLQGTTTFQLRNNNDQIFTPPSAKNLVVTLDGVLQEPEVAYTISGNNIIFSQPPLGPNQKLTGANLSETTDYSGVTFYGRYFSFKDSQYNNKHFRKLRNIFQRSGRWLDAANQIERNIEFIVGESVGYGREIYPSLDWSTKLDDYQDNIRNILDAYQHDIRFGGNVKTADYSQIFVDDSDFSYLTTNKTESLDIFRYATNLARLAVRNWDLTLEVNYLQGSFKLSVESTKDLAVGMHISSGQAYPAGTKIVAIDSETQVTLSNAALSNSGGGGGAPVGDTILDGDTDGDAIVPTSTLIIEPGTTYTVNEGDTVGVPSSFSGAATATFFFSRINSGRYYDASDLIEANREWIAAQSLCDAEVEEAFPTSYTYWYENPRDFWNPVLKYIDAVVYHLRYGGNKDVAEYSYTADFTPPSALLYAPYSLAESLVDSEDFILQHSTIVKTALSKATDYMIQAMRNTLSGRPPSDNNWSSFVPDAYQDPEVIVDTQIPVCADVASTLNTFRDILEETLQGNYTTEIVPANDTKTGYWTSLKPYVNYTLIPDPNLPYNGECDDVVSSIDSLYDNLDDIFNGVSYTRSLPDYIDGENKIFELYWEDGSGVFTEEDEDLFVTINAVLQRPKYNADYPGEDSYYIDRTTVPNKIVFDVAPIWDQDFGAKSIGEPTAVENVIGIGVGNYKRLTIDKSLLDGTRVGPFLILDVEDNTVTNIEEKEYLYVFVDGILQREGYSYTVVGPNIYFNVPIKEEMNIDMRLLYGREVGQLLNLYDFEPDSYYAYGELALQATNTVLDQIESNVWRGDEAGKRIHCLQYNQDTTYNVIGELYNSYRTDGELTYRVKSQSSKFIEEQDIIFAIAGSYDTRITIPWSDFSSVTLSYEEDEVGRKITKTDNIWYGTSLRRSYRSPFVNLATGDQIKIDGQDKFRKIKTLPSTATSKEGRRNEQITNNIFGTVSVESYAGITRGEGLSVVAIMETVDDGNGNEVLTGRIERLEWNQRSYEPITQPTAYQYYTPPILEFEPQNGDGGGARALVSVSKGQVVSVDLINPGSGYTKAPIVRVARNYTVLKDRDIGVSLINNSFEVSLSPFSLVVSYSLDITLEGQGDLVTSSAFVQMPGEDETLNNLENRLITLFVKKDVDVSDLILSKQITIIPATSVDTVTIPQPTKNSYAISVLELERPAALSESIVTDIRNREFVSVINTVITNPLLSNVNQYEVGAYLDIDALLTDTILYIPDTTKFSSNGILLVGDEIVRYSRKLSDRFLDVERAQKGTTAQFWPAGTFLRQIPDLVSVAFGGVASIQSESSVSFDATSAKIEIVFNYEFGDNEDSIVTLEEPTKNSEAVRFLPGSGIYDRYVETIYMSEDILTRSGIITGVDVTVVEQRSNTVTVRNIEFGSDDYFVGNYEPFNAGPNIGNLDTVSWDSGESFVSGVSIEEYELHYNSLTIQDFTDRKLSSYTISRDYVNLVNPSIQNPVQHVAGGTPIGSSVNVHSTHFFPSSGYFYHSDGTDYGIVYYGSKTSSSFEDCVNYRGNFAIGPNSDIIPYTGSESSFVTPVYQEPQLDLNFANAKSLNNQVTNSNPITFSRNSIATYVDENGIIQTAQANEARFTHDSNGNSLGLLVEEERTNYVSNSLNSDFLYTSPKQFYELGFGGFSMPAGTNHNLWNRSNLDQYGVWWTVTFYLYDTADNDVKDYLVVASQYSSTTSRSTTVDGITLTATGQNALDPTITNLGGGLYKCTAIVRNGNAGATPSIYVRALGTFSGGEKSLVSHIQAERGRFPTSYIPTSGSTVTRQRDAVNILGTSFTALGFNGEQGTFYLEHEALEGTNNDGTNENTLLYNVGANGNLGTFYNTKSDTQDIFVFGSDYGSAIRIAQTQTIDRNKVAFSYDAPVASYGAYIDGVAQTNVTDTNPYQVSTYNQFNIAPFVDKPFSGTIGRLIYWSTKVDDNQVELITT